MPDDPRTDEQLIEDAHKAVEPLLFSSAPIGIDAYALNAAITALGKRLIQRTEEKQAAEEIAAHAQELAAPVVSGALELEGFLRHRR